MILRFPVILAAGDPTRRESSGVADGQTDARGGRWERRSGTARGCCTRSRQCEVASGTITGQTALASIASPAVEREPDGHGDRAPSVPAAVAHLRSGKRIARRSYGLVLASTSHLADLVDVGERTPGTRPSGANRPARRSESARAISHIGAEERARRWRLRAK